MITLESGCKVCAVPVELVPAGWDVIKPMLKEALDYNRGVANMDDVYLALLESKATLWLAEQGEDILAAAVTEIVNYPRGNSLRVWLLAGKQMNLWKEGIAVLEMFARHNDCRFIEAITRRGMEKLTRDLGFETKFIWSIKAIDKETH